MERIQELVEAKDTPGFRYRGGAGAEPFHGVRNMVRRPPRGFVNYERYRGFTLTAEGQAVARGISRRHRTPSELRGFWGGTRRRLRRCGRDIEHHPSPDTRGLRIPGGIPADASGGPSSVSGVSRRRVSDLAGEVNKLRTTEQD